ncbi:hypothetical protein GCM10009753_73040 [Streptantibioticus ferralitis]
MSERTMCAVVQHELGGPEALHLEAVPLPTEILVRVHTLPRLAVDTGCQWFGYPRWVHQRGRSGASLSP